MSSRYVTLLVLLVAAVVAACGDPVGVRESGALAPPAEVAGLERTGRDLSSDLLPLDLGTRWASERRLQLEIRLHGSPSSDFVVSRSRIDREIIGIERLFERDYVVQEERETADEGSAPSLSWWRYRQDETGLYEADVAGNIPPNLEGGTASWAGARGRVDHRLPDEWSARAVAEHFAAHPQRDAILAAWERMTPKLTLVEMVCGRLIASGAADGPLEGEITRLAYPLRKGDRWKIRAEPSFEAAVEGVDRVRTPAGTFPAWRIRIENEFLTPEDRVVMWWGQVGMVGWWVRVGGVVTDASGNEIGRLVGKERQTLRSFERGG